MFAAINLVLVFETRLLQLMEINRRVHKQNNVPREFPLFVRNGFSIKIIADGYEIAPSGLIYKVRSCSVQIYLLIQACVSLRVGYPWIREF